MGLISGSYDSDVTHIAGAQVGSGVELLAAALVSTVCEKDIPQWNPSLLLSSAHSTGEHRAVSLQPN